MVIFRFCFDTAPCVLLNFASSVYQRRFPHFARLLILFLALPGSSQNLRRQKPSRKTSKTLGKQQRKQPLSSKIPKDDPTIDPEKQRFFGNTEWRLAPTLHTFLSRVFPSPPTDQEVYEYRQRKRQESTIAIQMA